MTSSPTARALLLGVAATLVQLTMVIAFAWPATQIEPRDVPLVVAGPQSAAVAQQLEQRQPGAFDIEERADEAAARQALADREAYGAIVTTPAGPRVIVASAASPLVSQQLTQVAQQMAGVKTVPVQDVVAADADDPRGSGFGAMALPLVMSGIAGAVLLTLLIPSVPGRLTGTITFAVLGGLATAGLAQGWLSILPGSYLAVSGVMALTILAVTGTVAGIAAAIGRAGIGLGALTFLLLGNPLSAATSAPELLPEPWGMIGQLLPPGAAVSLLRSVAFFDGANAGGPLTVLLAWAAAALALFGIGALRSRRPQEAEPADRREPALAS
ncbi:hypothetical protein [Actinomadura rudentiformis]|uniref:ABC transporter permease n=1 Tax=Actinomadura rudentiformis TaxID=359158 RepID=A0A6H9Z4M3_9ACTN|nr:hypothetical protein [Actinomadura rudentiformis]KAB2350901.1 hypothetical protein F8566_08060 [Actinomadura rudentiformis]